MRHDPVARAVLAELKTPEAPVSLLLVPLLLTLWVYWGRQDSFVRFVDASQGRWNSDIYSTVYEYLVACVLMFCVPALVGRILLGKGLKEYGLQLGDTGLGLRLFVASLPLSLLAAYLGSLDPAMQIEYPLAKNAMRDAWLFVVVEAFYLAYYMGWEFLFRGFMLFPLERRYGALAAILIQTIPSTLAHIGKPFSENLAAIAAGLAFGYVALRTRSILYPLLLHALVGIGVDVFITLR